MWYKGILIAMLGMLAKLIERTDRQTIIVWATRLNKKYDIPKLDEAQEQQAFETSLMLLVAAVKELVTLAGEKAR